MEEFFTFLYPIVGLISLIGYMPQIKNLIISKVQSSDISLQSWGTWTVGTFVTMGYATFAIGDLMFIAMSVIGFLLCSITTALIIYNRYYKHTQSTNIIQTDNV